MSNERQFRKKMKEKKTLLNFIFLLIFFPLFLIIYPGLTQAFYFTQSSRNSANCSQDLESLIEKLLPELPSYVNRLSRRFYAQENQSTLPTLIIAGHPEFIPLPLTNSTLGISGDPHQVFMTVLMREYQGNKIAEYQEYYWLFFEIRENHWQLLKVFSISGKPSREDPRKLRENHQGIVAEAIRLWLKNCQN